MLTVADLESYYKGVYQRQQWRIQMASTLAPYLTKAENRKLLFEQV